MTGVVSLRVNGEVRATAAQPQDTLLEVLRYRLQLTGSKQGCDKGDCGACTVLINGVPTLACLTLAATAEGQEITTIEGLASGGHVHAVQDAFDLCGALQCGFCQPGMMLSSAALLAKNPRPTDAEIREAISGNLCRCTGYTQIVHAVKVASGQASVAERDERPTTARPA